MFQPPPEPAPNPTVDHHLSRQLNLRDLVFSQVLCVVGSAWVGIAAGLGHAQTLVWLLALVGFYLPMAAAVYYLNRENAARRWSLRLGPPRLWRHRRIPSCLERLGLRPGHHRHRLFTAPYRVLPKAGVGPSFAWVPENHLLVLTVLAVLLAGLGISAVRGLALGKWVHNIASAAMILAFALLIIAPFWAMLHHVSNT